MGDVFEPDITQISNVSPYQQSIQRLVASRLGGLTSTGNIRRGKRALNQLLEGTPTDISAISDFMLRRFDQDIAPRINLGFAGIGGSLSSRRGTETARALGNVQSEIGALQVGMMESARQRQLAALGALFEPLRIGAAFSTAGTQDQIAQPSPFSQLLGLGGQLGSAALLGGGEK